MANNSFIVPGTPHNGFTKIATTSAQVKSDGTSAGSGTDLMYCVIVPGANGTFVQRVRFSPVANTPTNSVACVLRVYLSTVSGTEGSAVGATTTANTQLIGEISVPIIACASTTVATVYFDVPLNIPIKSTQYIHVSQSIAQNTNQSWQATGFGGDY